MEIACRVYKPRRPRESPLYQFVERHLDELLRVWSFRFARRHGPLRAVVERVLREFLRCGLLEHGFARLWVRVVSPECSGGFLLSGAQLLPVLREEKAAPLDRVAQRTSWRTSPTATSS